jgi:hypothetical protein
MSKHAPGQTLAGLAALIVAITIATRARAQSETPPSEPATIDTARGPITGSTRQIGLGGAFVAIADDSEGVAINPAATAVRLPYSWHPWDYGVGVDVSVGAWLPKNDIYNQPDSGNVSKSTALVGSAAGVLYYQHAGIGSRLPTCRRTSAWSTPAWRTAFSTASCCSALDRGSSA